MHNYPNPISATTAIGDDVKNSMGEDLGEIKEIMLDTDSGRIAYAVLSFGGLFGLGDKLFAIPWEALTLDAENHTFILDVKKEKLEQAPGFDKDNWPSTEQYETGWLLEVYEYYDYPPYWS